MGTPQSVILPEPGASAYFAVLRARRAADARRIAAAAARLPDVLAATGEPSASLAGAVGFGPELWERAAPGRRPRFLRPFATVRGAGREAPATGGDVFVHLGGERVDLIREALIRFMEPLRALVGVADEADGFRYRDSRDLTGFIDGTENPHEADARARVALIGGEDPAFAGGSYVFAQRWVHDLERWAELPVREQERVIGRTKADSRELPPADSPPTAHIRRVAITGGSGEEPEIVRHSFPYARAMEAGLFFVAYTRDPAIPEAMLHRMMGAAGDGLHDHLTDFTTPVTGAFFFVPSLEVLESLRD